MKALLKSRILTHINEIKENNFISFNNTIIKFAKRINEASPKRVSDSDLIFLNKDEISPIEMDKYFLSCINWKIPLKLPPSIPN